MAVKARAAAAAAAAKSKEEEEEEEELKQGKNLNHKQECPRIQPLVSLTTLTTCWKATRASALTCLLSFSCSLSCLSLLCRHGLF